ncbi:MAG: GGDEF domain-containing protein [Burkholderiaceae bacterium]|jgi:diguanylate cyclase (GGDEF)-like protein|nr:GGDEF domain-containing protein [Burkholderiaceae bacterium]MCO5102770.1 GGDEF domain-containing protein [Burkholderiaceae bacterium]
MSAFGFRSVFSARRDMGFAMSEGFPLSDTMASGFNDTEDHSGQFSRRHSDALRLRRQRTNAQKWLIALVLIGGYGAVAFLVHWLGYVQWRTLVAYLGMVAAGVAGFVLLFRTGWHQKFREKRLKLPIVVCCLGAMLVLVYLDPAMQILLAPFTFVTLAYGMYRISRNTAFVLAAAQLLGYAGVLALHYLEQQNLALLKLEAMHFAALAVALPGFVYLTGKVPLLHMVLNQASRKIRTIEADARRDAQLGCYNRRYIVAALEEQKQLADELGLPLCIAILDLDHFKRINDEMGHLGGDEVLRTFSRVAQQSVRDEDIFGRYGGEEFLLIFPGTSLLPALNTCERVRAQVEDHVWSEGMRCRVTVSIGVTQYVHGESVLEFFSRADTATYLAKEGGRNQVVVEEPVDRAKAADSTVNGPSQPEDAGDAADEDFLLLEEAGFIESTRAPVGNS